MASLPRSFLAFSCLLLTFICCFIGFAEANEVVVGGRSGSWKIPSSPADSFSQWAQNARFKVGDFLVFPYEAGKDSVLQVTKEAYMSCNNTNPISEQTDGNTKVKLDRPGPFYFISGAKGHCQKGQKVLLVVVTPRDSSAVSPAPSPAEFEAPAVAPTSGAGSFCGGLVAVFGILSLVSLF